MNWKIFVEKTFADCSLVSPPKDVKSPNFTEILSQITTKPRKFSPSKVSHYMVTSAISIGVIR